MHFQDIDIQRVEYGIAADFQVIRTRRGIRRHLVVEQHTDSGIWKCLQQALVEHCHGLCRWNCLGRLLHGGVLQQVDQGGFHGGAEVGQRRVTGVEDIGGGAVEVLGYLAEFGLSPKLQHLHHTAILATHPAHDLRQWVELAQFARDIAFDFLELSAFRAGVEVQWVVLLVERRIHPGEFATAAGKKLAPYSAVPLDGIENANWPLGLNDAVRQRSHQCEVVWVCTHVRRFRVA